MNIGWGKTVRNSDEVQIGKYIRLGTDMEN